MSNSALATYRQISPNKNSPRNAKIDTITIHCVVGQLSAKAVCDIFAPSSRGASSNYIIGKDGEIAVAVDEGDRSWCSSNAANDNRAVTIECACDAYAPYAINSKVWASLINLCADIAKRNGMGTLKWKGDKKLIGQTSVQNMTVHRWFDATACPGDYLYNNMGKIASEVNTKLTGGVKDPVTSSLYRVRKSWSDAASQKGAFAELSNAKKAADANTGYSVYDEKGNKVYPVAAASTFMVKVTATDLNIRRGPGTNYDRFATCPQGVFTIVETAQGTGSTSGWGLLKSYSTGRNGWIALDFTTRV